MYADYVIQRVIEAAEHFTTEQFVEAASLPVHPAFSLSRLEETTIATVTKVAAPREGSWTE